MWFIGCSTLDVLGVIRDNPPMTRSSRSPRDEPPRVRLAEASLHDITGYQLAQAAIVTDAVFEEQVGGPLGLRRVEYTVLALVCENPGGTPARLARALAVTAGNITMWVDRLADKGWVRRETSTTDRRAQHLFATAAGQRMASDATARIVAAEVVRLHMLTQAERAILNELLHKLAQCR